MSFSDPSGKCPVGTEDVGNGICEPVDGPVPQKPGDNSPLPPTEGYDPTQPPQEGISWVPLVDPLRAGAPGLPKNKNGAQNSVPGWEGTKNLCGLVSLAAIFHAYDSQITTSDLVSKFDYWRHHLAPNKDWAPKGPGYQGIDELVNFVNYRYYPHWIARKYALGADLGITIKTRLLQHQYMIVGVVLDPENGRLKTVHKEGYADHWVVVTGISKQYIKWGNTSSKNWVRIFDPYRNQTMYYWYSDFLRTKELNSAYLFVTHSNDLRIPNYPCRPN